MRGPGTLATCALVGALLAALFVAAAAPAPRARAQSNAQEAVDGATLVRLSGIDALLVSLEPDFASTLEELGESEAVVASIRAIFEPRRLSDATAARLDTLLTDAERAEAAAFYRSPLGKHLAVLARAAETPESRDALSQIAPAVAAEMAADPRRAERIDAIVHETEAEAVVFAYLEAALVGAIRGRESAGADAPVYTPEEIDRLVEGKIAEMLEGSRLTFSEYVSLKVAFDLRTLEDAELDEYLAYLRSDSGRRFYAATKFAVIGVLEEASANAMEAGITVREQEKN